MFRVLQLVGNICTIGTNFLTNGTIGKEIGANGLDVLDLESIGIVLSD